MSNIDIDWSPNPNNPALAEVIPGEVRSVSTRRIKQRARCCKHCFHVNWRTFETQAQAVQDEYYPEPCDECGQPFGDLDRRKRGWIYEPILSDFNAAKAFLPDHHKPPSLMHEKNIR